MKYLSQHVLRVVTLECCGEHFWMMEPVDFHALMHSVVNTESILSPSKQNIEVHDIFKFTSKIT